MDPTALDTDEDTKVHDCPVWPMATTITAGGVIMMEAADEIGGEASTIAGVIGGLPYGWIQTHHLTTTTTTTTTTLY